MLISLIVAMAANRCIGRAGQLPWQLPGDLQRFRQITMGQSLLMGRKTYESIGQPLTGRQTIVLSRDEHYQAAGCEVVSSLHAGIAAAREEELFVCGGEEIYRQALPVCERLYLTELEREVRGDRFFPEYRQEDFLRIRHLRIIEQESYTFSILARKV